MLGRRLAGMLPSSCVFRGEVVCKSSLLMLLFDFPLLGLLIDMCGLTAVTGVCVNTCGGG